MNLEDALSTLRTMGGKNRDKVAERRGVPVDTVLGVSTANIRKLAKELGENQQLATELWHCGYHEARLLGILIAALDDDELLNTWVADIDSWDVCDQFAKRIAEVKQEILHLVVPWVGAEPTFERRAGLALIANHCMKSSELHDDTMAVLTDLIRGSSTDERPHVRQACCWALRELGKIYDHSHDIATGLALELSDSSNKASAWVGHCAYKELESLVKIPERRRLISRNSKTAAKYINQ